MKCTKCRGERRLFFTREDDNLWVNCPRCLGTGTVTEEPESNEYFTITVRRKGTKDEPYERHYLGSYIEAERICGHLWNYFDIDDRFRLTLRKEGQRKILMSIG